MCITESVLLWKHFKQGEFHRRQGCGLTHHSSMTSWPKPSRACITKAPWHLSFSEINKKKSLYNNKKLLVQKDRRLHTFLKFPPTSPNKHTHFSFDLHFILNSRKVVIPRCQSWLRSCLSSLVSTRVLFRGLTVHRFHE